MISAFKCDATGYWVQADPSSDLDYGIALKDWLQSGEKVAAATWIVPSQITKHNEQINTSSFTDKLGVVHPIGTLVSVWLSPTVDAQVGVSYTINCRFMTDAVPPRTDERSFRLVIKNL